MMTTTIQDSVELQRICGNCNLIKSCARCKKIFCPHYSSKIDFQFCAYCFHDVTLEDSIIRRIEETRSLSGKKIFTRIMRARHLVFKGQDWMFAQQRVVDMTDAD